MVMPQILWKFKAPLSCAVIEQILILNLQC